MPGDETRSECQAEIDALVASYMKAARAGRAPDPAEMLARHPHLAGKPDVLLAIEWHLAQAARPGDHDPLAETVSVGAGGPAASEEHFESGARIGPYKLLEVIGEGGMGTVYLAEQARPMRRRVALKLIKAGMDSKQVVARFEAERQALALMDHPNIAKVLDAGATDDGRPYFVMELVKGVPITKYCDDNRLTPRRRLALFVDVCRAVQHAHQKGVIHRDIKPSNVLVALYDGKPVPKVIDFGLAKAVGLQLTEKTLFTGAGAVVGTPAYMSPEQARLDNVDIDTRSDVYSLGVVLYELLTGTTPVERPRLQKAALLEVLRLVREEEPPRPSARLSTTQELPSIAAARGLAPRKLSGSVRGELDWIVMRALEKDRNRRYESAGGLAQDVGWYLRDEPVAACPPSAWYRLRKLARRNRGPVLAAALVLLALVGGVVGTTWGMVRADKARQLAEANEKETDKARQLAEAKEKEALKARDAESSALAREAEQRRRGEENLKLASAVLEEIILEGARQRLTLHVKDRAKGRIANPEREKLEREYLEKGLGFYEQLAQTNATDWAARRERAKAYSNVGFIQLEYRNIAQAEKAYRQAIDLMEKLAAERPEDFDNRFNLACDHLFYLPNLHPDQPPRAEEHTRRALVLFERLLADFPDESTVVREHMAVCQRNLGQLLTKSAKPQEAEQAFQKGIALWSGLALVKAHPKNADYRHFLAYDYHLLANLYTTQKRFGDADQAYKKAVAGVRQLVVEFDDQEYRTRLGGILLLWAFSAKADGRLKEAEKTFRESASEFEALRAKFPKATPWAIHELGYIHFHLGVMLAGLGGRDRDAEEAFRQSLVYHEKQLAQDSDNRQYQERLAWSCTHLARLLRKTGRPLEAVRLDARRIVLVKKMADGMNNQARGLVADPDPQLRAPAEAVELARQAVELAPAEGKYWSTLGAARYRAGSWRAAVEALNKSDEILKGDNLSFNGFFLAMTHHRLGDKNQARRWYDKAVAWMDKSQPGDEELRRFRAEAAELLGVAAGVDPPPKQKK